MRKTLGMVALVLGMYGCSNHHLESVSSPKPECAKEEISASESFRSAIEEIVDPQCWESERVALSSPSLALAGVSSSTSKNPSTPPNSKITSSKVTYVPKTELSLLAEPKDDASSKMALMGTLEGRYQRVKRWHPQIYNTESRYGIPGGLLAGVFMQESGGDPLKLNADGDGGAGMAMFQPGTAKSLGLKVYERSDSTGRDTEHGEKLEQLVEKYKYNLGQLAAIDERFHPVKATDAAGKLLKKLYDRFGTWEKAVSAYRCGSPVKNLAHDDHVQKILRFSRYYLERNNGEVHPGDFVLAYHTSSGVEGYEYIVQPGDLTQTIKERFQKEIGHPLFSMRQVDGTLVGTKIKSDQRLYLETRPSAYAKK